MKTLITINSTIPHSGPAEPSLVFFDDGRWEITYAGDVDYVQHGIGETNDESFVGSASVITLLDEWLAIIELDPLERDGENVVLFLNQTVEVGRWNEPVVVLFANGDAEVTDRETGETAATEDEDFVNFVPIDDLVSELRDFVADFHAKDT